MKKGFSLVSTISTNSNSNFTHIIFLQLTTQHNYLKLNPVMYFSGQTQFFHHLSQRPDMKSYPTSSIQPLAFSHEVLLFFMYCLFSVSSILKLAKLFLTNDKFLQNKDLALLSQLLHENHLQ